MLAVKSRQPDPRLLCEAGISRPSANTDGKFKGRDQVGIGFLRAVQAKINSHLNARIRLEETYQGHVVKSIDGSCLEFDDTEGNQLKYPNPAPKSPGAASRLWASWVRSATFTAAWRTLPTAYKPPTIRPIPTSSSNASILGDILCGDHALCTHRLNISLSAKGAFSLMRLHAARQHSLDWREGKNLGSNQRLVTWQKPTQQPSGSSLSESEWEALSLTFEICLIRFCYQDRDKKSVAWSSPPP